MNLKVGDKVRVRKDLRLGSYKSSDGFSTNSIVSAMTIHKGKIATITEINGNCIRIDLDNGKWGWIDTMFEEIKEEKVNEVIFNKPSFIHSDVTKVIRNDNCVVVILDTGEKGIAKCCPEDEFNLEVGYRISYQRATIERLKNEIKNEEDILNIEKGELNRISKKLKDVYYRGIEYIQKLD